MSIDINRIYTQYQADQRDGAISNLQTYVYTKYNGLTRRQADSLIMKLKKLISNDNNSKHPTIR
jgi:hypothetical protein